MCVFQPNESEERTKKTNWTNKEGNPQTGLGDKLLLLLKHAFPSTITILNNIVFLAKGIQFRNSRGTTHTHTQDVTQSISWSRNWKGPPHISVRSFSLMFFSINKNSHPPPKSLTLGCVCVFRKSFERFDTKRVRARS